MTSTERAHAYLAKLPPAIAGSGGHKATYAAACRCVEFGLNAAEALERLLEWNVTHCQPPWTETELRHKLADAFRATLPKEGFTTGTTNHQALPAKFLPPQRVSKPLVIPPLTPGTKRELATLAKLRGLSIEGVSLTSERGLLRFGVYRGCQAWFILDQSRRNVQARRLDGLPWAQGVKAWTLPGSQAAWPIGIREAGSFTSIALCEGGPDLLAAFDFMIVEGRTGDVAPVTMLGGCSRIHPESLPIFGEKRVRIFAHLDQTGDNAANRWAEQLADCGATVDAFSLAGLRRTDGETVKDLCDLAAIHADDFEKHRCLWEIFDYAARP